MDFFISEESMDRVETQDTVENNGEVNFSLSTKKTLSFSFDSGNSLMVQTSLCGSFYTQWVQKTADLRKILTLVITCYAM